MSLKNIRLDLLNTLKNANVLSTTVRGVTTSTYTATATSSQTTITIPNLIVRNIRSFTIDAVSQLYLRDFTFVDTTGVITVTTPMTVGQAISVQYDYSTTGNEKIYPDLAREELQLHSYPRVGMELTSMNTKALSLGGDSNITDGIMTIFSWVSANKDSSINSGFGGMNDLMDLMTNIRTALFNNKKSLYTIPYMVVGKLNPVTKSINNKIIQCSVDVNLRFIVET
jgi:hypothetical protein